jgi:dipeptidyl aminopeptidase/acylaminoacyl peptidase
MILGIALTIVLYLLIAVTLVAQSHAAPDLIPREILFGNPVKASPQISPNGKYLSYLAPVNNVLNIWVRTLGERDDRAVTKDSNRGVTSYFWQEDGEHILYVQDTDGDENWRLYSVKIASEEVKAFTPFPNVQVRLIAHEKHLPHEVLIQLNKRDPTAHDVYHLDLRNGELTLLEENPGNFVGWLADHDLNIRGATVAHEDGSSEVLIRNNKEDAWRTLVRWEMEDDMNSGVVGFTKDATEMYLKDSRGVDTGRFIKINLQGETLEVIAEDPHYDFGGAMLHPDTYEVQTVSFTKERNEVIVLDEAIRADIETIKTLDSGDFFITSRDQALEKWVVGFVKDDGPVRYYLYEVNQKKGTFLFSNQPDLENYELSPIEPISYTTRDGLTIHGYLTMPPGMGRELLPMVLMVHGGPWARNTWGYDPRAQWVANRGYACLQVNYRGSTGYGKSFVNAGDKEWGGKMHDDLVDAVHWAIQEKIADPERLAIFGGSYGGYAALAGAAFTPDLFTCAVSIVGPSNLITFIKSVPPYWKNYLETIYRRVGNPETEVEFLKSRSPLTKVDNIKIPMLIGQGANDPRVKQAESEQIVAAMKEKGIQYEYLLFPDEGHGFVKPQNRLKFYQVAEKFLADHLGGRYAE